MKQEHNRQDNTCNNIETNLLKSLADKVLSRNKVQNKCETGGKYSVSRQDSHETNNVVYHNSFTRIKAAFNSDFDALFKSGLNHDEAIDKAYDNAKPKLVQLVPPNGTAIDTCQQCKSDILQGDGIAYVDDYSFHYKKCYNNYKKEK